MAPQRLEKIESAPGNGMGSEPRTYNIWYAAALTVRDSGRRAARTTKLQKKAPKVLKSFDAKLKSAPALEEANPSLLVRRVIQNEVL